MKNRAVLPYQYLYYIHQCHYMVQVHHYHLVEFLFLFSVYNIQLFVLWIQFLDSPHELLHRNPCLPDMQEIYQPHLHEQMLVDFQNYLYELVFA